jgi:Large polyvalent protein associated domain 38
MDTTTTKEMDQLGSAGFSQDEVSAWAVNRRKQLSQAGFNDEEIDKEFGQKPFDAKPIVDHVKGNLDTATAAEAGKERAGPAPVKTFADAIEHGWQISVPGLLSTGKNPTKEITPDTGRLLDITSNVTSMAADFPVMVAGGLIGGAAGAETGPGAAITSMAGAVALPQGMRKILMDKYSNGEVQDFKDFWSRASGAIMETMKGWVFGAATGAAGLGTRAALAPLVSPTVKNAATVASAVTTMATVGAALEGHIPSRKDFEDAAVAVTMFGTAAHVAGKFRNIYAQHGVRPADVLQDVQKDPTILGDVLSSNIEVPKTYGAQAPDTQAMKDVTKRTILENLASGDITEGSAFRGASKAELQEIAKTGRLQVGEDAEGNPGISASHITPEGFPVYGDGHGYIVPPGGHTESGRFGEALVDENLKAEDLKYTVDGKIYSFEGMKKAVNPPAAPKEPTAQEKILSHIVQGEKTVKRPSVDDLITSYVDRMHPIKEAEKGEMARRAEVLNKAPETLPPSQSPYTLERLTAGIYGKGLQFLKFGTYDPRTYKTNGKSYEETIKPVKNDLDGFRAYMASKRAIELSKRGMYGEEKKVETGFDLEAAKQVVKEGKEKYQAVFDARREYKDRLLNYLKSSGILNDETLAQMKAANEDHVPFYRYFEDQTRPATGKSARNPIKKITGSERKIYDPIESDVKDTFLFMSLAEKNMARQAMVKLGPEVAERMPQPIKPVRLTEPELKKMGNEIQLPSDLATIFRAEAVLPGSDRVVVYHEGKRDVYKVDPKVAEAFNQTDKASASYLADMLNLPAKMLRAGTVISPDFFPRNLIRDAVSSFVYASSNPIKTAKGAISLIKHDEAFQNWLKSGGANATMVSVDRDYISKELIDLNVKTGLMQRSWNIISSPLRILQATSELFENATRLGTVRDEMKVAKNKATMQALAMISRNATVDFNVHGGDENFQKWTHATAFMNPSIQGMRQLIEGFQKNPMGVSARAFGAITIPTLYLWWANHDDPRYEDIPRWEKAIFHIVMTKDHIYRIPKDFGLGMIFSTMPEMLLDKFASENPDATKGLMNDLLTAFGTNLAPTAVSPIVEQFANRSLFTGNPIVPSNVEKLLPEYQYTEYTTEAAKALGQLFGAFPGMKKQSLDEKDPFVGGIARALTTPILLENYLHAWTGGIGMYALRIADRALREAGGLPDPVLPAKTLADISFVKAFVVRYPSSSAQSIQDFYDSYYQKKKVYDTIMFKAKEGDVKAVMQSMKFDQSAIVQLGSMREMLTQQSQIVRLIYKNPVYPPEEKRQLIDTVYFRMIEIAHAGNSMLRGIEKAVNK